MKILALDTGTKTGWATEGLSGVQNFAAKRGDSPGLKFLNFRSWLAEIIRLTSPDLIVYEQAHHRGGFATESCLGFVTEVKTAAALNNIELTTVHSGTLKKWACGHGKASKKDMIDQACHRMKTGKIEDDNEADAVLMYLYAAENYSTNPIKKRTIRRRKNGLRKNKTSTKKTNKRN